MITISGGEIYLVQAEDVTQQNDWCATGYRLWQLNGGK